MNARNDDGWIILASGRQFWPCEPRLDDIFIEDIAHGLSQENRYGGQVPGATYSVAEHSVHVSNQMAASVISASDLLGGELDVHQMRLLGLYGLLHDGSEGLGLKDIPRPVKKRLGEAYGGFEARLQDMIYERFGLDSAFLKTFEPLMDRVDKAVCLREREVLYVGKEPGFSAWKTREHPSQIPSIEIPCWPWWKARDEFLLRFHQVTRS